MPVAERQRPAPGELCLDHVAHFVPDLDAAARVLEKLGLKVTPASAHMVGGKPAGTANRTVMLEAGYIEITAPRPDHGLRLACLGTPDAEAEHRRLAAHGFEPPPLVDLSRKLEDGGEVRFKVVRTGDRMPEGRVQFVEHLAPEAIWRDAWINPLRLTDLYVVAQDPAAAAARWGRFGGLIPARTPNGIRLQTARGALYISEAWPWATPPAPALAGYGLACSHPDAFVARCRKEGLTVKGHTVQLPPALGGAWLIS